MRGKKAALSLALLAALSSAGSAHAFIFLKGSSYEKGERPVSQAPIWPTRTVNFVVNTNLSTMGGSVALPITSAELLQAAQESVNAWAAACRADLKVVLTGTTNARYSTSDSVNVIQWDNRTTAEGNYYGTATSTLAAATTVLRGIEFADCDIVLNGNSSVTMMFSPATGEADLRSVLTHEIGHCLGLDHPIEPPTYTSTDPFITAATMVQTAATGLDPSDPSRRDIAQDDRDAIECIYERGKPARSGLHCASYSGTNGQGEITGVVVGGPTATDTTCGGDSQGRNALPSIETGDGCITSAIASPDSIAKTNTPFNPLRMLGGTWGFLAAIALLLLFRKFRKSAPLAILALLAFAGIPRKAHALDLELSYGLKKVSPTAWNGFAGMDPGATSWDRSPSAVELTKLSEIRATAFSEQESWGKWGGFFTLTLPSTLETNGKALSASEQTKKTSIGGFRVGPELRYFPAGQDGLFRWFIGGRLGLGIFYGNQTFTSSATDGSLSYRAWSTELALGTGAEISLGKIRIVAEGGYSRNRSSYFTSTGISGNAYTDFPSGTRIASNAGSGSEDLKLNGSGLYATVGLQMVFGESPAASQVESTRAPAPAPVAEPEPESEPESKPAVVEEKAVVEDKTVAPTPLPTPPAIVEPVVVPTLEPAVVPTPVPLPAPTPVPTETPQQPRTPHEADEVPDSSEIPNSAKPSQPYEPDPVPEPNQGPI